MPRPERTPFNAPARQAGPVQRAPRSLPTTAADAAALDDFLAAGHARALELGQVLRLAALRRFKAPR